MASGKYWRRASASQDHHSRCLPDFGPTERAKTRQHDLHARARLKPIGATRSDLDAFADLASLGIDQRYLIETRIVTLQHAIYFFRAGARLAFHFVSPPYVAVI